MRRVLRIAGTGAVLAVITVLALPATASAHPLGNFTVNRYSGLVVGTGSVSVDHVLDLAEIPTAARTATADSDGNGRIDGPELHATAAATCAGEARTLELTAAGTRIPLRVRDSVAESRPGQAGLRTLRVECTLGGRVDLTGDVDISLVDTAAAGQVGWHEVTARGDGASLVRSDVPQRSRSVRLTAYPDNLLSSPLDVRSASVLARPGGPRLDNEPAPVGAGLTAVRGADRVTRAFENLLTGYDGSPLVAAVALLGALALGAAHAVAPGHGKTVMAFYLSGRREGSLRAAATVGTTVTVAHTAAVLVLGVLVSVGASFTPAGAYPWLGLLSGLLIAAVGVSLLRAARGGHGHPHGAGHTHGHSDGHGHSHGHSHGHGHLHGHSHGHGHLHGPVHPHSHDHSAPGAAAAVPGPLTADRATGAHDAPGGEVAPAPGLGVALVERGAQHGEPAVTAGHETGVRSARPGRDRADRRGLVAMGLAAGVLPSPSAVVVFLGALAVGRPWFGVAMVVAFGGGMAATLSLVGLAVFRLRSFAELRLAGSRTRHGRVARVLAVLPAVTASAVTVLGLFVAVRALAALG